MKNSDSIFSAGILAAIAVTSVVLFRPTPDTFVLPEMTLIPAGEYEYRPAGTFRVGTRVVDAPIEYRTAPLGFEIMKHHVRQSEYSICVADGDCEATLTDGLSDYPQVDVSYVDATAYARWFSKRTKQTWRLPTDDEWVRAAGDRFNEVIFGDISNDPDPSKRWLLNYRTQAQERSAIDPKLRPIGSFGANDLGVVDINGNIWEWTDSCFQKR